MTRKKETVIRIPEDDLKENLNDKLIPNHPNREHIYNKFYSLLCIYNQYYNYGNNNNDIQKIALNLERGIFNYTVNKVVTSQWNDKFKDNYIDKSVHIFSNLNPDSKLKNKELIHRLFKKEINEFELCNLPSDEIFPERHAEIIITYIECLRKEEKPEEITDDGAHFCSKCKTSRTTYYQLQTRSAKIIGWKSTLLITSWLCYWENSCSPSYLILKC